MIIISNVFSSPPLFSRDKWIVTYALWDTFAKVWALQNLVHAVQASIKILRDRPNAKSALKDDTSFSQLKLSASSAALATFRTNRAMKCASCARLGIFAKAPGILSQRLAKQSTDNSNTALKAPQSQQRAQLGIFVLVPQR